MATTTPTTTGSTSTTTGTTHGTSSTPLPSVVPTQSSTPTQSPTDTPTLTPTDTPTDTTTPSSGGSTSKTFTYSSANTSVATVSTGGKITAKGNGTTYITVKYPGLTDQKVKVNVLTYVTGVSITGSKSVSTGSKIVLSKTFLPTNASDTFKTGTWSSSDTNVATVDSNGNVTGKSKGTATIKYKTTTGTAYEGSYTITVNTSSTSLSVTYYNGASKLEAVSLAYRDGIGTYQLNVVASPSNLSYTFESSNTNVAAVSTSGVVTIKGAGTASVGAKFAGNSTYTACSDYVTFNVAKGTQTASISGSGTVTAGKTIQLTGTGKGTLSWTSNNTGVATVNASTGLVTGKSAGTATITLTAAGNANFNSDTATKQITVSAASSALSVSYYSGSSAFETVELNYRDNIGTYQLTVSNPNNIPYTYKTSNASVATVSTNGTVSIKGVGTANVYAYFEGNSYYTACEDYVTFKVNKGTQSLSISGNSSVYANSTLQLTQVGAKGNISWDSSDKSVATVSSVGLVTGKSAGKTTITLTSGETTLFNAKSVTKEITVNRNAQTFTISNASLSLPYGGTNTLTYSGAKTAVSWKSSNTAVASVGSTSGKVTATGVGTAKITATAAQTGIYNSYTKECSVTVSKANTSITLKDKDSKAVSSLTFTYKPGGQQYQLTYFHSDGVNPLNWTTSNANVVSLDSGYYGKLTIGSAGSATVKAYFDGNSYYNASSYTLPITVNKASQTISWKATKTPINIDSTYTLKVSGNATGMYYSSSNANVATVNATSGLVTGKAEGTVTITAYAVGNTNYNASAKINKEIKISKLSQTLSKTSTVTSVNVGNTIQLSVSGCNTSLSWRSGNTGVATVNASTGVVTGVSGGTATIYVKAISNAKYNESSEIPFEIAVNKLSQTVTAKASPATIYYNTSTNKSTITVTQGYGNATYEITSGGSYGTLSGNVLTAKASGTVKVKVTCAGNGTYNAGSTTVTITVTYKSGGSPSNPSNPDPVVPGGSSEPSGSSTPSASPTETPTPSSSPGEGGLWIEINGTRYYEDGIHSTNGSGGPESVTITCSSDVTYSKEKSWEGDFYYVIVKSKNSNQEIFRVVLGDTYMTSEAPTASPEPSETSVPTETSMPTQKSSSIPASSAAPSGTSMVS